MTRTIATAAALLALIGAAVALIAALLMPNPASAVSAPAPVPATATGELDGFLAALAPSTDLSPEQAADLLAAADLVCEGVTAEVPVMVMADTLAADLGLTDEEARHLVNTAATVYCTPTAL